MNKPALRIGGIYLLFSVLWIVFTDRLLSGLLNDTHQIQYFQTYKGLVFVTLSAFIVYKLSLRELKIKHKLIESVNKKNIWLSHLLTVLPRVDCILVNSDLQCVLAQGGELLKGYRMVAGSKLTLTDLPMAERLMKHIVVSIKKALTDERCNIEIQIDQNWYFIACVRVASEEDDSGCFCIIENITDLKTEYNRLSGALKYAEQRDKIKSVFLANMSHEIRTPLNAIAGLTELMIYDSELTIEDRVKYHSVISSNTRQLLRIINDIVDISKIQTNQIDISLEEFNLFGFVREIEDWAQDILKKTDKQHVVALLIRSDFLKRTSFVSDRDRIKQIVTNLVENAISYTEMGYVEILFSINTFNQLEIRINDTGRGIPEVLQKQIFNLFEQHDLFVPFGTGLGLSIANGLISALHGHIWLESKVDKGTKVIVTLPENCT